MRKVLPLRMVNGVLSLPNNAREWVLGGLKSVGEKTLRSETRDKLVSLAGLKKLQKSKVRQFLRPGLSVGKFFKELNQRGVSYVVMRWFEELPETRTEEDIDILIADEDIDKIWDLFGQNRNKQKFDIYNVTGSRGHHFKNLPYYPPELARQVLANRTWHKEIFAVPDTRRYFLSLAYHAVFHKGSKSGIPNRHHADEEFNADHDYISYLRNLAEPAGFSGRDFEEFNDLYQLLSVEGWVPEFDTLRKLAEHDPWLRDLLPESAEDISDGEMVVFIVRQWVVDHDKLDTVKQIIQKKGLEILKSVVLEGEAKNRAVNKIRGGKWDKGPFPKSGGPPAAVIICFDYHPRKPDKLTRKTHPFVKNHNVMLKYTIRDYINEEMLYFNHVNSIHSADNEVEAFEYLKLIFPQEADDIKKLADKRREAYRTRFPVLHLYKSYRSRAKIEKIDYHGKQAVKKTFKISFKHYLEREAFAYKHFSELLDTVPPLWEQGDNYIIIPWYDNQLEGTSERNIKKLLRPHAEQVVRSLYVFYREGYALIGFNTDNLLLTSKNQIKLIDFEFLYRYQSKPQTFLHSYDITGIPKDFDGDLPRGLTGKGHTWKNTWKPVFGNVDIEKLVQEFRE